MKITYEAIKGRAETDLYQEIESLIKKNPWAWQSVCAVIGLAGSILAPILGAISDVTAWFFDSGAVNWDLKILSIVLCALTLPLLILGAFCLDLLEAMTADLSSPIERLDNEYTPQASP